MESSVFLPQGSALVPVQSAHLPPFADPLLVYLARLAEGSRRVMRSALDSVARLLSAGQYDALSIDWRQLRYPHLAALRAQLVSQYRPATANRLIDAVRGVLRECWRLGYIDRETFERTVDIRRVRAETLLRGRALAPGELQGLIGACDPKSLRGQRDLALLAVLYGTGLRRSEVVALDADHYDPASGRLNIYAGKGNKDRTVYLGRRLRAFLDGWLALRPTGVAPLFLPVRKDGRVQARRMSDQAVLDILHRLAECAGVAHFSPHDLRRTHISDLLDSGQDLSTVQRLAGHASPTTTARYDRRGEAAKMRAADALSL